MAVTSPQKRRVFERKINEISNLKEQLEELARVSKKKLFEDWKKNLDERFEFNEKETISALMVNDEAYFLHNRKDILNESSIINLSKDLFKQGVLTFDNLKSNKISIKSKNNNKF